LDQRGFHIVKQVITLNQYNKMSGIRTVILLVSEEDGAEAYYRLSASHDFMLSRIHAKKFKFEPLGITCDDSSFHVDAELSSFLHRFRYGLYTAKWNDIAERLKSSKEPPCLPHEYWVTFYH